MTSDEHVRDAGPEERAAALAARVCRVRAITAEDVAPLVACARADNHTVIWPTHIVEKGGQIVGYGSVSAAPMMIVWLDTVRVSGRESAHLLNTMETAIAMNGTKRLMVPCQKSSPFHPLMGRMGFKELGEATLFYKDL